MPILTYHHVGRCPPEQRDHRAIWVDADLFRSQIEWLARNGWQNVTLAQVKAALENKARLPRKWVAITFDDGWRDNYVKAFPVLADHGYTATLFMVSGYIRHNMPKGVWNDCVSPGELVQLRDAGWEIGSHTHTHPHLTKLSNEDARREILDSRRQITEAVGVEPQWFCYPFGNVSRRIAQIVQETGYSGAVSTIRDNVVKPGQEYWMPRVMVRDDTTPRRLGYMLGMWYHITHSLKNRSRWKGIARA